MTYRPDNPFAPKPKDPDPTPADDVPTGDVYDVGPFSFPEDRDYPFDVWSHVDADGHFVAGHEYQDVEDAFAPGSDLFPPTWRSWVAVEKAAARMNTLADRLPGVAGRTRTTYTNGRGQEVTMVGHLDWDQHEAQEYLAAGADAVVALKEARADVSAARAYKDDDGWKWHRIVAARRKAGLLSDALDAFHRWDQAQEVASRLLPSLDDADRPWAVQDLLPEGGLALVVGAADSGKSTLMARLAAGVVTDEGLAGQTVMPEKVVVIDTGTAPSVLADRYADALAQGAEVLPFRGRAGDLDVRDPVVRTWLAAAIPAGALVIVDSLAVPMSVLDVSEIASDAGGYLAAWGVLAADAKAAGIVVVHASPESNPGKPRGHGSLAAIPDVLWVVKNARGKRTLETDTGVVLDLADAAPDPAKPEREGGAARRTTTADERRADLLDAVRAIPGRTTTQVADAAGIPLATADRYLKKMEAEGILETSKGSRGKTTFWFPKAT